MLVLIVCGVALLHTSEAAAATKFSKPPIVLIPGFASSRLIAWKNKDCKGMDLFDIHVGDRVWLDVTQVLYDQFQKTCWVECVMLEPYNQTDPPDCKLRHSQSIQSISVLDPGRITGPLSSIFRPLIDFLANQYDYDPNSLAAASYDFRLAPGRLQERDGFFSNLQHTFERLVDHNGGQAAAVITHSMGYQVFRYFVEWLKLSKPHDQWLAWLDRHVRTLFLVGPPLLGAPEAVRAELSGTSFGLPLAEPVVRRMLNTFGSMPWLFPIPAQENVTAALDTDVDVPVVTIRYRTADNGTAVESSYTAADCVSGRLFQEAASEDPSSALVHHIITHYYHADPLLRATPPSRPPVATVHVVYGVNRRTEIGYRYDSTPGTRTAAGFKLKEMVFEDDGGEVWAKSQSKVPRPTERLGVRNARKSGDGTVPYHSLAWAHTWHPTPDVRVTTDPPNDPVSMSAVASQMATYSPSPFSIAEWFAGGGPIPRKPGTTRYESDVEVDGRRLRTVVVEFDKADHRELIGHQKFLDYLTQEFFAGLFEGASATEEQAPRPPAVSPAEVQPEVPAQGSLEAEEDEGLFAAVQLDGHGREGMAPVAVQLQETELLIGRLEEELARLRQLRAELKQLVGDTPQAPPCTEVLDIDPQRIMQHNAPDASCPFAT